MNFQSFSTKAKILVGFSIPMLLVLILGGVMINLINEMGKTEAAVQDTHEVLADVAGILSSAVDMETGMRGYLLAGDEAFLAPYRAGEAATYIGIDRLHSAVSDNPLQVERLNAIRKLLLDWQMRVTRPNIELRSDIGDAKSMNDMAKVVAKAEGKIFFDNFRGQMQEFISNENITLQERRVEFKRERDLLRANFITVDKAVAWVNHTHEVIAATEQLLADALDIETGMRGFLLTGDEEFLVPYEHGRQNFLANVISLSQAVNDNPLQVERLKKMLQIVQNWISEVAAPAIGLREAVNNSDSDDVSRQSALEEIFALVSRKTGKAYFTSFREQVEAFIVLEHKLMDARQKIVLVAKKVSDQSLIAMSDNERSVAHTIEVLKSANSLLTAALDMETGMRGYLLAGKKEFLQPYYKGIRDFDGETKKLLDLVADNPAQTTLLKAANKTIKSWEIEAVNPTLELRRQIGDAKTMDDMADLIREARGKKYFDEFRVLLAAFEAEELHLMEVRQIARGETVQNTYMAIATFTGIVIAVGLLLARVIGNSIANPLRETTHAVEKLANSNTRITIPDTDRTDEIGSLIRAFNTMANRLHEQDAIVAIEIEDREFAENRAVIANKAKSEFLSNMSHELRTPLNSILILSKLLYENNDGNLTERQSESANVINSCGNDLLTLINNILDLSKVEAGKIELTFENVVIKEQTDLLLKQFEAIAQEKGLKLAINISKKIENCFRTDSQRLLQILKNLFSNAVKFTSSGTITLNVGPPKGVQFHNLNLASEQIIAFTVVDTGIGIPVDKRSAIFDAFQQADGSINRLYGGTGLGLTISRELATLLGGELHLSKSDETGCAFTLYLPISEGLTRDDNIFIRDRERAEPEIIPLTRVENNTPISTNANANVKGNNKTQESIENFNTKNNNTKYFDNKKVLLVDDDMRNIFAISNVLSDAGLKVEAADNGQLALDKLAKMKDINIVLMDVMMPVMDGLEAIRQIRIQPRFHDLPVIALTAKAMEQDRIDCIDAGANDYLTKPVDTDKLLSLMYKRLFDETG